MTCTHRETIEVAQLSEAAKGALACEDCVREGTEWVHLRQCLACGHVGCCDSSPKRHARAHARADDHPIVASAEPGERWRYCFADDEMIGEA